MILLSVKDLSRQFDAEPVFQNVSFNVRAGEKIGLVGANGTGKTTLLRVLAGLEDADCGTIEQTSRCTVSLLEQEPHFAPNQTLIQEAREGLAHLYQLQDATAELAQRVAAETDAPALDRLKLRYDRLEQELRRLNAYNVDYRVDEVLQGLGFHPDDYERPLTEFSGGQQNRILLARLLLRAPELMLLDEPTNHLDISTTEWLEDYLSRSDQAMILVSHDRYFLDKVTRRILELHQGTLTSYSGNFSAYWRQSQERRDVLRRTYEKQQDFIAKTENFIRKNKYGQTHAQAADRVKKLERIDRVDRPQQILAPPMAFDEPPHSGEWVIDAANVSKGYDAPLFIELTLRVERGDRIGILGPNGSGKTTLLRTLINEIAPDTGSVRLGTGVRIAYFDQQLALLDPSLDAIEAARPADDPSCTPGKIRSLLARFGLRGDVVFQKVGSMSGGEKSKVALAQLAARRANLLVLDEPTNHLDIGSRAGLETALIEFPGTVLFVSHDRYFLDRVATRVLVLELSEAGKKRKQESLPSLTAEPVSEPLRGLVPVSGSLSTCHSYEGNYSAYLEFAERRTAELATSSTGASSRTAKASKRPSVDLRRSSGSSRRKRKFPYRKVVDLERDVAETEALLEQLQTQLADADVNRDPKRIQETKRDYEQTRIQLDQLYEHWEESLELN